LFTFDNERDSEALLAVVNGDERWVNCGEVEEEVVGDRCDRREAVDTGAAF
jgi:hypothetical protein